MTKFKVEEFYSGHDYNTVARKSLWDLLATKFGGWECAANRFENYGREGLYCRGITKILRGLIDPKDLSESAFERYGTKKELTLEDKEKLVLKTLSGNLAEQFKNKFPKIYKSCSGRGERLFPQEEFGQLDKTFNIPPSLNTKISTTEILQIAIQVSQLLEPLNEEDKLKVVKCVQGA